MRAKVQSTCGGYEISWVEFNDGLFQLRTASVGEVVEVDDALAMAKPRNFVPLGGEE